MSEVSLAETAPHLELNPVFKVLLHVQADERMNDRDTFRRKTHKLVEAMRNGNLELSPATVAEYEALIERDDQLRASLEEGARQLNLKTLACLCSDDAPQGLLTLEEYLWVHLHLAEGLVSDADEPALQKVRAQAAIDALDAALDDGFIDAIGARLKQIAAAEGNLEPRANGS